MRVTPEELAKAWFVDVYDAEGNLIGSAHEFILTAYVQSGDADGWGSASRVRFDHVVNAARACIGTATSLMDVALGGESEVIDRSLRRPNGERLEDGGA